MQDRVEMTAFIKEFVTRDYLIKVKLCQRLGVSLATMNRVMAGHPKVRPATLGYIYAALKAME